MDVKEKIILAAIECIERYGITDTTIRKIGAAAGVNSAAVSYHFGGEKNLIDIAMRQTLGQAFTLSDYEPFEGLDLKGYLCEVFGFLIKGALKFPNISKAHLYPVFKEGGNAAPAALVMNAFLEELLVKIRPKTDLPEKALREKLFILMSEVVYFIVSPELLSEFTGKTEPEEFTRNLINTVFGREWAHSGD